MVSEKVHNIFIVIFIAITAGVIGYKIHQPLPSASIGYIQAPSPIPSPLVDDDWWADKTYESVAPAGRKIMIKNENGEAWIQDGNNPPELILTGSSLRDADILYDGSKATVTDHISNEDTVYIIDFMTKKYVIAEGAEQFVQSQPNYKKDTYTHVYTNLGLWYDKNSLVVTVSGHPDFGNHKPEAQLYLVDANTGKVIKRLL